MKKITETLEKNRTLVEKLAKEMDFSVFDERDAKEIKNELASILGLLGSYMDFENGISPDNE